MSFARPELLWLALLALPELALALGRMPLLRASVAALAGPRRRAKACGRFTLWSGLGTAAACLFCLSSAFALAGPSWGSRGSAIERRGLEAAIVLDVSRSMEVRDMGAAGTRLDAAKELVGSLLGGRDTGAGPAAFSLVAVKGAPVLLVPMTEDRFALEDALAYADPDAITATGTDLEKGLRAALASFSASGAQGRLVFFFTDGGELAGSFRRACEETAASGVRLVVVGVGGRVPAPVPGPDGAPLAGEKGPVLSALDAAALERAAAAAGGRYLDASKAGTGAILAEELGAATGKGMRIEYGRVDRSSVFALAALVFLALAILASMLAPRGREA